MEQHAEKIYSIAKRLIPQVIKRKMCAIRNVANREISRRKHKKRTVLVFGNSTAEKRVVLFVSPEHGNLGDHAIAKAEMAFFRDYMPEIPIVEISYGHYLYDSLGIKKYITKNDVLVINGGGYLGTLWFHDEEMVRDIIERFPDNKIIILPQTIFFEDGDEAKKQLAITKAIYSNHRRLLFCAREQDSYNFVTRNKLLARTDNCYLIPDMVTYVCESKGNVVRNGILLCIRKDKECILSDEQKSEIEAYAKMSGENVYYTDTVLKKPVSIDERYGALESKFDEFRRAKLVITDRLHGMLFAAVTGTPCIAMNNKSGKVKGCYRTIQHLKYIEVIDNPDEILDHMASLLRLDSCGYDNNRLLQYYEKLARLIRANNE